MKKFLTAIILALVLILIALPAYAANIEIKVDGISITTDVIPETRNNRIMVPLRVISENLGASITWTHHEITLSKNNTEIILQIGSGTANVNGKAVSLDAQPYLKNNRTMVPLRFLTETLGYDIDYKNHTVTVNTEPLIINGVKVQSVYYEYHMTIGGVVQEISGNAYNKALYELIIENDGGKVEAPARYSWMVDIDTPGAYYKLGQYHFLDLNTNTIQRFDIYSLVEAHSAETLSGYPKVLIHNVTADEWNLFSETALQSIYQLIETATNNGFVEFIE